MTISGSDQRISPEMNAGLSRRAPVNERAATAPTKGADTDRGVQEADAAGAESEEVDRCDDDVDLNCSCDGRLSGNQSEHDAKRRVLGRSP